MAARLKLFIAYRPDDGRVVEEFARRLGGHGIDIEYRPILDHDLDTVELKHTMEASDAVALAVGRTGVGELIAVAQLARQLGSAPLPLVAFFLPGTSDREVEQVKAALPLANTIDVTTSIEDDEAIRGLGSLLAEIVARALAPDQPRVTSAKSAVQPDAFQENIASVIEQNAPAPEVGRPTRDELDVIFRRLTDGGKRALAEANSLARQAGDATIHIEHLVAGLYRWRDGRTRSALDEVGVTLDDLASMLELSRADIGPPTDNSIAPIDHLPRLSAHVERALFLALEAAIDASGGAIPIRARHLFYGALNVPGCTPIEKLLATPLRPASVLLDAAAPETTTPDATAAPPETDTRVLRPRAPIADFQSDDADGNDLLNIEDEVEALSTVIAASKVDPPLALGLFGDWGTGKTFFMNKMQKRIDEIAKAEKAENRKEPFYCRNIVQLRFNAWHYIDQDLWASLAAAIFDGLDQWITTSALADDPDSHESKRAGLLTFQARKQDELEAAERLGIESRHAVEQVDESLRKLEGQYGDLAKSVPAVEVAKAVVRVAADQPEIRGMAEEIQGALDEQMKKTSVELQMEPEDLGARLAESSLTGLGAAIRSWLGFRLDWRLWVPIAIGVLLAAAIAALILNAVNLGPVITTAGLALSAAIVAISPIVWPIKRVWGIIRGARAQSRALIETARSRQRDALLAVKQREVERGLQAEINAAEARKELDRVRNDLLEVEPSRQMATFIKRRQASEDYRSRLGVVAKARDDFEQLTKLLAKQAKSGTSGIASTDGSAPGKLFAPIDRIVLYIDDLDRCKESDVVAVLQAVHLLLAFRLFVVVVAVDPRWLLHSLRVTSRVLKGHEEGDDQAEDDELGWEATPLNYLEKIFQVPFALRPMGKTGFQAMVAQLVTVSARQTNGQVGEVVGPVPARDGNDHVPVGDPTPTGNGAEAAGDSGRPIAPTATTSSEASLGMTAGPSSETAVPAAVAGVPAAVDKRPVREVVMNPDSLDISKDERDYMGELHELIGTPRAAKRFVNVYRLLKASTAPSHVVDFEHASLHQPIILLLAVLTGYPAEATEILRALLDDDRTGGWLEFVAGIEAPTRLLQRGLAGKTRGPADEFRPKDRLPETDRADAERWSVLLRKLARIEARTGTLDVELFRDWARPVARYGFESSRILLGERPGEEPAPAQQPAAVVTG